MHNLTLQVFANGQWRNAMELRFEQPEEGLEGACAYGYQPVSYTHLDVYKRQHAGECVEHRRCLFLMVVRALTRYSRVGFAWPLQHK